MVMVNVVTIAVYKRIYWLILIGLIKRSCYIRQMNRVNSGRRAVNVLCYT